MKTSADSSGSLPAHPHYAGLACPVHPRLHQLAGNVPAQGLLYPVLFTGLNVEDFGYPPTKDNAASSTRFDQSASSTYLSAYQRFSSPH
jgi:hypothetical protein